MREVEDRAGRRYHLIKRSQEMSLVADPQSGSRRYLPNDEIRAVEGTAPEDPIDRLQDVVAEREPVSVRTLLDATTLCESDLHGYLAVLESQGWIRETSVHGERGYVTDDGDASPQS